AGAADGCAKGPGAEVARPERGLEGRHGELGAATAPAGAALRAVVPHDLVARTAESRTPDAEDVRCRGRVAGCVAAHEAEVPSGVARCREHEMTGRREHGRRRRRVALFGTSPADAGRRGA